MKKRSWINSIAFRTGINSLAGFSLVMIFLVTLFLWSTNREFRTHIIRDDEERVQSIIRILDRNLQDYQAELQNIADSPTLINAVMNPIDTDYYIPDFMENINIRNLSAEYTLVTFDGMVIYSTSQEFLKGESYPVILSQIRQSEEEIPIFLLNDSADVGITGTVRYNRLVEGYLIMNANFRTIFNYNLESLDLQLKDHQYSASYKGRFLAGKIEQSGENLTTFHTLEVLPIDIHVSTPVSIINEPVRKLLMQMLFLAVIASVLAALFLSFISSRIMAKPLLLLERGIRNITSGRWEALRIDRTNVREIQFLSRSFNTMQSTLQKRTTQLEKSNADLQTANQNLKTAQKQLIHSEKMASIGQLAAGVAHEINNPIGFITTNLSTMTEYLEVYNRLITALGELKEAVKENSGKAAAAAVEVIEKIEESEDLAFIREDAELLLRESADGARRIRDIVQGLKNFARPDSSDMVIGNLNQAIEDALKLTWNELKYKCEVIREMEDIPDIECRPDQLTQVFVNLLINAEHAIENHGTIRIRTYTEGGNVVAKVCDSGSGIPEEHLEKLFDPFFTTKKIGRGTGLGLSISHGIIEEHGGDIIAGNSSGGGACFQIIIPIEKEPVLIQAPPD